MRAGEILIEGEQDGARPRFAANFRAEILRFDHAKTQCLWLLTRRCYRVKSCLGIIMDYLGSWNQCSHLPLSGARLTPWIFQAGQLQYMVLCVRWSIRSVVTAFARRFGQYQNCRKSDPSRQRWIWASLRRGRRDLGAKLWPVAHRAANLQLSHGEN